MPQGGKDHRKLAIERLESRHLLSATYYVDVDGLGGTPSDNNTGTIDHPLATLQAAVDRVGPGDTIVIRGGIYDLANGNGPISFNINGLPGEPVTIEAYPGEQPIFDLGMTLQWQTASPGVWCATLPEGTAVTDVSSSVGVEESDGWGATTINGSAVDGGPPPDFTQPPAGCYQGNQLAYDLSWYNPATQQVWLRSNQVDPITDPDSQCEIVSSTSQFHLNSGYWVNINGLQIQDGFFGIHVESQGHVDIMNCRVLHCDGQGILGVDDYGEIADNFVDYIGGGLSDSQGTAIRSHFGHAIYLSGIGTSIHDNFFGQSLSGYSGQITASGGGAPMTIANNVFYGSWADGLTLYGGQNAIVTGNVCVTHPVVWDGIEQGFTGSGMRIFFTDPDAVVSGNYVEGAVEGLVFYSDQPDPQTDPEPGIEIVGNTSVGGYYAGEIDGIPGVMNDNHWAGSSQMVLDYVNGLDFAEYLAWANALGFETNSTYQSTTLIDPFTYDPILDGYPSLASVLTAFRQYASNQINAIAGLPADTPTTIGGTSTPDASGVTPIASDGVYQVAADGTLVAGSAQSLLANDSSHNGETLTADWFSGPEHGQLSLNADGTFSYTPSPGFYGVDQFVYRVYDTSGGMAQATVTVNVTGALAAVNESYTLDSTSTLTVLAPGVLADDMLPGSAIVSVSATNPQDGTLLMRSDGSFDYTPNPGYTGSDSFIYTVTASGQTSTATVTLAVQFATAGVVAGPDGNDTFRIWQSPSDWTTINALCDSSGGVLTYSVPRIAITQWVISGGAGEDLLEVDYSNGDPLPSQGVSYDGGALVNDPDGPDANRLLLLGINPDQEIRAGAGQFTVGDGEPVNYKNVQEYGADFTLDGNADWEWWPNLTIMFSTGILAVSDSSEYVGDIDSGAGIIQIDGPTSVDNLVVEKFSQLAGSGAVNFSAAGGGLYYISYNTSAFGGTLSGPGTVEVENGYLTLTGANSYTGGTNVGSGSLVLEDPQALPGYSVSGSVSVASGATLTVQAGGDGEWDPASLGALLATTAFTSGSTLGIEVDGTDTFVYGGDLAGAQPAENVTKFGTGTLILSAANSYSGAATIAAGTLQVGDGSADGTLGSGAVVDNGVLSFDCPDPLAVDNAISGTGSLVQAGGAVLLPSDESYSGGTVVSQGALLVTNGDGSATGTGDVTVQSGATLGGPGIISNGDSDLTIDGTLQPHLAAGDLSTLTFTNSSSAGLTLDDGASLNLDFAAPGSCDTIQVNGNLTLAAGAAIQLVANQAGSWTPGSVYDFLDYAGNLIGAGTILPPPPVGAITFVVDTTSSPGHVLLDVTAVPPRQIYFNAAAGSWSNAADWSLSPTEATPHPTTVPGMNDIAEFPSASVGGDQAVTLDAAQSALAVQFAATGSVTLDSGTGSNSLSLGEPGEADSGIQILSGAGAVTINAPLVLNASQAWVNNSASPLAIGGSVTGTAGGSYTLTLAGSGSEVIDGAIGDPTDGATTLFVDCGTVTLTATNTYSGGTVVDNGTVVAANVDALPEGTNLTIAAGGTLVLDSSQAATTVQEVMRPVLAAAVPLSMPYETDTITRVAPAPVTGRSPTVTTRLTMPRVSPDAVFASYRSSSAGTVSSTGTGRREQRWVWFAVSENPWNSLDTNQNTDSTVTALDTMFASYAQW